MMTMRVMSARATSVRAPMRRGRASASIEAPIRMGSIVSARVCLKRRGSVRSNAAEREDEVGNDTMNNLDKLLGTPEPAESSEPPPPPRALDAEAKKEGARVAADLAAAQARIAREKAAQNNRKLVNPEEEYDYSERAIAALVYMLPLLDSLKYSKFLFMQFPMLSLALLPLAPVISLWGSLGFLQVVVFFATYLGVVQNQNMKRFVRFNAQQAILLDILLIVPDLLTRTFQGIDGSGPTGGVGLQAEILFFNSVFLFTYICCTVGAVGSTAGKEIKLPLIGDAADMQQPR
tara:strand:+ start:112 stop:984 length:873 start_codon:yes stop_codon:yes gene_type:complete